MPKNDKIEALPPPQGRRITQISSSANSGGTVLFVLCDDGSVWSTTPFHKPRWTLVVQPNAA